MEVKVDHAYPAYELKTQKQMEALLNALNNGLVATVFGKEKRINRLDDNRDHPLTRWKSKLVNQVEIMTWTSIRFHQASTTHLPPLLMSITE